MYRVHTIEADLR